MKACTLCSAPIVGKGGSTRCRPCAAKNRKPPTLREPIAQCGDCGRGISGTSKSGLCKSCATARWNRLPETRQKRIDGWKKRLADPEKYAQLCKIAARNSQKAMTDPEKLAKAQENGRRIYRLYLDNDEMRARIKASRKRAGEKIREYRLGWCPEKYRDLHRENVERHRCTAAESRAMIEKMIANEAALKHVSDALDYLKRLAPVRVLENGYQYGNAILTPAEVIERAKLRGWQPDRWAA